MSDNRTARIWALVAAQAASRGASPSVTDVCAAAVGALAVSGAGLTAVTRAGSAHVMDVTDDVSERLAELQLTLGEGPRADASAAGGPVLVPDLAAGHIMSRWPGFAPLALEAGAAAIFAFPLQIGAIRIGILELYRGQPGPLTPAELGDALVFADTGTLLLLDGQGQAAGLATGLAGSQLGDPADRGDRRPAELAGHRAEIDQATGMLTEQLGVGVETAFVRLRAYAYAHDRRLQDVARDVVTRRLRLGSGSHPRSTDQ